MKNPIGICFPDFIGPGRWIAFLRKAWRRKIPERSEDDFSPSTSPQGRLAANNEAIQYLCRLKAAKRICQKQEMQTFKACISR